ncbi:hypothetical protein E2C01_035108 [Portunus trituberculatus]|uniref:Uncharacterized protein n=1 Tax=Portunus trituberculatus TaxID=210409 RepID=A0A5B7F8V0_PORTR|nr:hypothetical protein [Portunus trituberculatus]
MIVIEVKPRVSQLLAQYSIAHPQDNHVCTVRKQVWGGCGCGVERWELGGEEGAGWEERYCIDQLREAGVWWLYFVTTTATTTITTTWEGSIQELFSGLIQGVKTFIALI